jgi:CheY-like chemotaxis protein
LPAVLVEEASGPAEAGQLRKRLRDHEQTKACPVVWLRAAGRTQESCCAPDVPEQCLQKPPKESALAAAIAASLRRSDPSPTPLPASHSEEPAPLRILLAEDSPVNQEVATGLLELRGHEVQVANDGAEAFEAFQQREFDVILMDVEMPEMDGLEATAAVRQFESGRDRHTPIIAMTAHAVKGFRDRCLDAGMDGYVSKPIQPDQLFREIESVAVSRCRDMAVLPV